MSSYLNTEMLTDLQTHYTSMQNTHMRDLFADDDSRFHAFSLQAPHIFLDYSKNRIVPETMRLLSELTEKVALKEHIEALFSGQHVNVTEDRPALHTALRDPTTEPLYVEATNAKEHIKGALDQMRDFVKKLYKGKYKGYSKKAFKAVVHFGVGGSHLGPAMTVEVLGAQMSEQSGIECHFVSSLDATELDHVLKDLDPETTLFIIASKSFTTQETLMNAERAKNWLANAAAGKDVSGHFVATTAQPKRALKWGISEDFIFPLWDWVNGRCSLWSTIGLPIAIAVGMDNFDRLLAGAYEMDQHFRESPVNENMPVVLALLSFWYTNFFQSTAHALLPYDYRLRSLPSYLEQLSMESNGKSVHSDGTPVTTPTAPILFGEKETDGQHSFHQLLLQGTHLISCDFIATLRHQSSEEAQPWLLSHCFAQSEAFMFGKTEQEVKASLQKQAYTEADAERLAPHKAVKGNQPSNTLLIPELTPEALGALIALYEHKTYVEGVLWSINSFDQFGVELGKEIAKDIAQNLVEGDDTLEFDASTQGLINYVRQHI